MFFFFKQKTAYEMRISDWSSDVCSSDLEFHARGERLAQSFVLPGGKAVGDGLRIFERRTGDTELGTFSLIGQGSGGYRAEPVFVDVPQDWVLRGKDGNTEIEAEDFAFAPGRSLYRCAGQVIAEKPRSAERRLGKGCVSPCRSLCPRYT